MEALGVGRGYLGAYVAVNPVGSLQSETDLSTSKPTARSRRWRACSALRSSHPERGRSYILSGLYIGYTGSQGVPYPKSVND